MACLENGTYEEIVAHLGRELELNALEELVDLPIATMASASSSSRNLLSNGFDTNKEAQCSYCKETGHLKKCSKLKKKKGMEDKTTQTLSTERIRIGMKNCMIRKTYSRYQIIQGPHRTVADEFRCKLSGKCRGIPKARSTQGHKQSYRRKGFLACPGQKGGRTSIYSPLNELRP